MGTDLIPEDVSALLELNADDCHRFGDRHFGKNGREYAPFREGLWSLNNKTPAQTIDDLVQEFAETLSNKHTQLRELRLCGLRMDLFLWVKTEDDMLGLELTPDAIALLAALGVAVSFDIYFLGGLEA